MFKERESSAGLRAALIHAAQPTAYNVHSVCIEHNVYVVVHRLESPRHGNTQPQYMSLSFHRDTGGARAAHVCLLRPDNKTRN